METKGVHPVMAPILFGELTMPQKLTVPDGLVHVRTSMNRARG